MKYIIFLFLLVFLSCSSADTTTQPTEKASATSEEKSLIDTIKDKAESDEGKKVIETIKEKAQDKETQEKIKGLFKKDEKK
jgi:hypothetical protein